MGDNKGRNYSRSNYWCSQDGINQNCNHSGRTKTHVRSNYRHKPRRSSPPLPTINSKDIESSLHPSTLSTNSIALGISSSNDNKKESDNLTNGLTITGIVIGSLLVLSIIIYYLIQFIKKRKESSGSQEEEVDDEELPHPQLTINFVKHNHPIPELCTTPDTQPILDYYSSKAGLTDVTTPPVISSNKLYDSINDHKSIIVEINKDTKGSPEENVNHEYVPQYYNGMEIPPLGARIIPLERQVQIAKELTSTNLSPTTNKRKSNRSISSILSISSRRKSSTSSTNNNYYNNNSSTTNSLTQISETPRNENAANIAP
ncbi:hypothetical protein C1645_785128 [Glomus cerebriforme]|uniref:Uncharacterized protein n=1 Tax=Glomus cerebriforme TaxID=658196 RepID=A0A397SMD8_9GLOM|nr:hypothetical protein C1645_785128 [Glomus cerebriforme]